MAIAALALAFRYAVNHQPGTPSLLAALAIGSMVVAACASRTSAELREARCQIGKREEAIALLLNESGADCGAWLWRTDATGNLVEASPNLCKLFGGEPDALIGRSFATLAGTAAPETSWREFIEAMTSHHAVTGRLVNTTRGQRHITLRISAKPCFESGGRFAGYCGVAQDVTRERDRERNLRIAATKAQQASVRTAQYLQAMSHELRAPLISIVGFAEVLTSAQADNLDDDEKSGYLRIVAENGRQLRDMARSIADLTQLEQGTLRIVEQEADAAELAEIAAGLCQGAAEAADVTVVAHVLEGFEIRVDVARLRYVLTGLVRTAIERSPAGGSVAVSIERTADSGLCFKIVDCGAGFTHSPAMAEGGREGDSPALVSIYREIAFLHGGDLTIARAPRMTTARLLLPADRVLAKRQPADPAPEALLGGLC